MERSSIAAKVTVPSGEPWDSGRAVADLLIAGGYETYAAGGCVRDLLLGREVHDIDLATVAHPEEVESLFASHGWRTTAVGKAFGVVIVVAPSGANVEVATFRHDGAYIDGRRPEMVTYGNARDDVERRDFTVNALLLDLVQGMVVDHVGGRADLERRVIRAVGDAAARLREDRLRVLRGMRFAARLGFTIEATTWTALCATPLAGLSAERLMQELDKALSGPGVARWLHLLRESAHLAELCAPLAALPMTALDHLATRLDRLRADDPAPVRLAVWLSPLDLATARDWLRRQPLAAALVRSVGWLVEHARPPERWTGLGLAARRRLWQHADGRWLARLLDLRFADQPAQGEAVRTLVAEQEREHASPWVPLVRAGDLIALGLAPGPRFGAVLRDIEDADLEGRFADREAALAHARQVIAAGGKPG
jgi:poly(A) polymerase